MAFAREIIKNVIENVKFRVPSTEDKDSYYTMIGNTLVRISNHCTRLCIWDYILEKNPKWKGIPIISIVFEDGDSTFNEQECLLLNRFRMRPIVVKEYVYHLQGNPQFITRQDTKLIIQSIKQINNGVYTDTTNKCSEPESRVSINPQTINLQEQTFYNKNKQLKPENKMKKTIRLTESDIKKMVMEAMNELDWKTYDKAAKRAYQTKTKLVPTMYGYTRERDMDLVHNFRNAKADAINNKYFKGEDESDYFPNGGNFAKGEYDTPPTVYHGRISYEPGTEYDDSPIMYHGGGPFTGGYKGSATYDDLVKAFNGDEEKARNFMAMCQEFFDYKKGKYEYKKGIGWTTDKLNEAVACAIRKYLH